MLPTNAWRANPHLQPGRNPPRNTSFEYEFEYERTSFRRLASPPRHYHQTPSTTPSLVPSEVYDDDVSDSDESSTATRKKHVVRLSRNPFTKVIACPWAFLCTVTRGVFRLLFQLLWIFLKLVDRIVLQHLRAIALRLVVPLFLVTFAILLISRALLGIALPLNVPHMLRLPESPATSMESAPNQLHRSQLSLDSTRRLENTHSSYCERTSREIRVLEAHATRQSVELNDLKGDLRTLQLLIHTHAPKIPSDTTATSELNGLKRDLETLQLLVRTNGIASRVAASSELRGLRGDLEALQLLVRTNGAEIASHAAASSELHSFRRDLEALQLLVRTNGAEIASYTAASSEVNSLRRDLEALRLLVEGQQDVARPDFALHSTGASVIPSLTSPTYTLRPSTLPGKVLGYFTGINVLPGLPPVTALHYDIHDGHCWPFPGSYGQLGVVLGDLVYVEAITIDHVAAAVSVNTRTSAPKDIEIWAMVEGQDNVAKLSAWRAEMPIPTHEPARPNMLPKLQDFIRIASLQYDMHAPKNIQTFPVDPEIRSLGIDFGVIVLVVKSNWGMEEYTCLYRIRVHGRRKIATT
ncbi:hypothetical protein B0H16DRAFT_1477233 [Mycena metata]|uniref:SUN domain-containing protein n=1 Tax=Mycena metata TaxID=1033252 RepID=A0AAD7H9C6_9AGAR|nr:hypothetical protein B0H16DRAFT_1477233 [Mycena metata]